MDTVTRRHGAYIYEFNTCKRTDCLGLGTVTRELLTAERHRAKLRTRASPPPTHSCLFPLPSCLFPLPSRAHRTPARPLVPNFRFPYGIIDGQPGSSLGPRSTYLRHNIHYVLFISVYGYVPSIVEPMALSDTDAGDLAAGKLDTRLAHEWCYVCLIRKC